MAARALAVALAAAGAAPAARALETGLPQYPLGVDTVFPGDYPPMPGLFVTAYGLQYSADTYRDRDGRSAFRRFNLDVSVAAVRPVLVWDATILGARPISYVVLSYGRVSGDARFSVPTPAGPLDARFGDAVNHVGDVTLAPLMLNWRLGGNTAILAGAEIFAPTGGFSRTRPFNLGANTWTIYPEVAVTHRFNQRAGQVSLKLMYGFQTRNDATGYRSGQHLIAEGSVGHRAWGDLSLELAGFALAQTTDDRDRFGGDGLGRSRLFGLGPQLRYDLPGGAGGVTLKYQREFGARNAPEGNRFWIQAAFPLYVPRPPAPDRP